MCVRALPATAGTLRQAFHVLDCAFAWLQNSLLLPWAASKARAPPMGTRSRLVQGQQSRCGRASRQVLQHPCASCYYLLALYYSGNNQAVVNMPHRMELLQPLIASLGAALIPARAVAAIWVHE